MKRAKSKHTKSKGILRFFIPQYDEISLFAMSMTCTFLFGVFLLSTTLNEFSEYYKTYNLSNFSDFRIILAIIVFFSGLTLSIYHAFTDRPKSSMEKYFMLFFAVILNAFSGFCAGAYALSRTTGWLVVFPILNIVNAVILLFMFRINIINEENIRDENASLLQIVFTAAVVFIMFVVCHYMYKLIWIQTLSICVVYATNIGRKVQPLILYMNQKEEAASTKGSFKI
ncbi:MAG: hypothetical protein LLG40_09745 [Deltaproteobacteria bacterium]|nr:hypothetical protein [Deltaproteobacteria bacterium]